MIGLIRWSPVVTLVVGIGALLATVLIDQLPSSEDARATIGLTQASEWPFHDSWLASTMGVLDDGSIVSDARTELGLSDDATVVVLNQSDSGSPSTITITASASTSIRAADLANAVAEGMLEAVPSDAPVTLADRADAQPAEDRTRDAALAGAFVGLIGGLAMIPWLDRNLGRLRASDHPALRERVAHWIDLTSRTERILPLAEVDDRLIVPLGSLPGPLVVVAAGATEPATKVAKTLAASLAVEVLDAGSAGESEAGSAVVDAGSILIVAQHGKIRRPAFEQLLDRIEALGAPQPSVVVVPTNPRDSLSG